ncbi:hypothetical protein [Salipiger abyssi]|uniref:hypothetical protein n=1 Tax=Salipiger abyssi TaxID=1250539 RepID=UPI00405A461A
MPTTKIATCSYCGTRAALILDAGRHELVCASCGAPLHELKQLRPERVERDAPRHRPSAFREDPKKRHKALRKAKTKKKKSLGKKAAKGLFDLLDDIFD